MKTSPAAQNRAARIALSVLFIAGLGFFGPSTGTADQSPAAAPVKPDYRSLFLAVGFSPASPAFSYFSVDSLGGGKLAWNPVLDEAPADSPLRLKGEGEGVFVYAPVGKDARPVWTVRVSGKKIVLRSTYIPGLESLPFVLTLRPESQPRHAARPDEAGRTARRPALRSPPAGHGLAADHGRRARDRPWTTTPAATSRRRSCASPFPPPRPRRPRVEYSSKSPRSIPALPGIETRSPLRRLPPLLPQHLPGQSARPDAGQQRLERSRSRSRSTWTP